MCHFEGEISERANWDFIAFWQKKIPVKKKDTNFFNCWSLERDEKLDTFENAKNSHLLLYHHFTLLTSKVRTK